MASPQKENGYTSIAHEILEAIVKTELTGTQFKIILLLWRYTYGFNRPSHAMSISFIATALNVKKPYISVELNKLIVMDIIRVETEASCISTRVLAFNKNYEAWGCATTQQVSHNTTVMSEINLTVMPELNLTVMPQHNQERKIKDNLKKDIVFPEKFEEFYSLYPNPFNKPQTYNNFKNALKQDTFENIMIATRKYIEILKGKPNGMNKDFIKKSTNFLGQQKEYKGYLEMAQQSTLKQLEIINKPHKEPVFEELEFTNERQWN